MFTNTNPMLQTFVKIRVRKRVGGWKEEAVKTDPPKRFRKHPPPPPSPRKNKKKAKPKGEIKNGNE